MTSRKKRLRIIQFTLLITSILLIYFTYYGNNLTKDKIISKKEQKQLDEKLSDQSSKNDVFYNITYRGLDLSGNRYVLNAEEALNDENFAEEIYLKNVDASFYLKNNTILKVFSDEAIYNNKTLDMIFENVKALWK